MIEDYVLKSYFMYKKKAIELAKKENKSYSVIALNGDVSRAIFIASPTEEDKVSEEFGYYSIWNTEQKYESDAIEEYRLARLGILNNRR
jgi:hypothetical protein